ncbi:hypothetical protein C8F04DRAFT_388064 [Mycena alexandri]|uniref:DUF6534 domain-containing protein n=1 Tax=Mycena alexandri TaxID=1745969 RepID=A0AAD6T1C2_9AGAR|nr:hypothetical protein C8F04DRAFT_388064 [Mycena alexandri]
MFALGDLFAFVFTPDTTFYAMFAFPIGRIYTNALLNTLNARMTFHERDQESDLAEHGQTMARHSMSGHTRCCRQNLRMLQILSRIN